mmetsp:Transcript_8719/g.15807  ORF Transcript_8719/g.15807 Transcript_8719/m.15807 type:complete len:141 (-) Transcript_8719:91-513(-)
MKSFAAILALVTLLSGYVTAFSSFTGTQVNTAVRNSGTTKMEYIPSGMSKEEWKALKEKEKQALKGKNLGATGITSFKSRSFADWQKSGGKNLFPVDPKKVKNAKEIPYMQRPGGMPDDSDLKEKKGFFDLFGKKEVILM